MTKAKPIELNKSFYYYKWITSQNIIFSIYPEIEAFYKQLSETVSKIPIALEARNKIINNEIATIFNGHPIAGMPIYS
jgi:hypothetical protein